MTVDLNNVTEKEIAEAQKLIEMLPVATADMLVVDDYRTIGLGENVASENVIALEEILANATSRWELPTIPTTT